MAQSSAAGPAPQPPTAVTGEATDVTLQEATLHGSVNPGNLATTYYFRFGPDTHYGRTTPVETIPPGTDEVPVKARISGLQFGHLYHYRLVARNELGTDVGVDRAMRAHEPRLEGSYRVRLRITRGGHAFGQHRGMHVNRGYRLDPRRCTPLRCRAVKLRRQGKTGRFRSVLRHRGIATFAGTGRFHGWCDNGLRFGSASRVKLRATEASGGRAVRLKGRLRVRADGCINGSERARLRARAR